MKLQFIRVHNRIINLGAISYVRMSEDRDLVEIRLLGPSKDVTLTVELDGEEAVPVREFFLKSGIVQDLRPGASEEASPAMLGANGSAGYRHA